ncbi:MAG: hypothetical protein QOH90_2019 [Actinomycetota bacterium]|nr:hypothetical protein [Actinomycetota bacterium]
MEKTRKRRGLLRVAIATGLLTVALTSVAAASQKGCSMDPRDPALTKPGAELCHPGRFSTGQVPVGGDERANIQHLVPDELPAGLVAVIDRAPEKAPVPAPSQGTQFELEWLIVGMAILASGTAGLIVGHRRGPHALSA